MEKSIKLNLESSPSKQNTWGVWRTSIFIALFLLSPKIGFFDITIIVLLASLLIARVRPTIITQYLGVVLIIFSLIVVLVGASGLINQHLNVEWLAKPIRNIIIIYSFFLLSKKISSLEVLFFSIGIAGAINSFVVLLQYIAFIYGYDDIIRLYPVGETGGSFRMVGLSSGYPSSALLSAMAASIFLVNYYLTLDKIKLILLIICLPGCLLSARTGLILFVCVYAILIIYSFVKKNLVFFLSNAALILLVIAFGIYLAIYNEVYFNTIYIMFEFLFVYFDEGRIGIRSTDDLMENHYFFPQNITEWIIGNSQSVNVLGGIQSDVWITQNLNSSGIFVVLAYICVFLTMWYMSVRATKGANKFLVYVVFSFVFISSFKGSFLFSRFVGDAATIVGVYTISRQKIGKFRQHLNW